MVNKTIGRFSALAISNVVHITSYYEGKAYYYLMMKNGSKINIDEVSITDTEEKNGVEVRVEDIQSLCRYERALGNLYYFKDLYVHSNINAREIEAFNSRKIFYHNSFSITFRERDYYEDSILSIGNVIYHYDPEKTKYSNRSHKGLLKDIVLKFEIGDLDVTPNRENLLYSEKTIEALNCKIREAIDEITTIYNNEIQSAQNIVEYFKVTQNLNIDGKNLNVAYIKDLNKYTPSYKSSAEFSPEQPLGRALHSMMFTNLDNIDFIQMTILDRTILNAKDKKEYHLKNLLIENSKVIKDFRVLVLPSDDKLKSPLLRGYIRETYGDMLTFVVVQPKNILASGIKALKNSFNIYNTTNYEAIKLIQEFKRFIAPHAIYVDVVNSEGYKEHCKNIKSRSAILVNNPIKKKNIRFYVTYRIKENYCKYSFYKDCPDLDTLLNTDLSYRENTQGRRFAIVGSKTSKLWPLLNLFYESKKPSFYEVTVAETNYKAIKTLPKRCVRLEDFVTAKNKAFIDIMTMKKYRLKISSDAFRNLKTLKNIFPKDIHDSIELIQKYDFNYDICPDYYNLLNEFVPEYKKLGCPINFELAAAYEKCMKFANIMEEIDNWFNITKSPEFIAYLAIKHKLFRVNYRFYEQLKNNLKLIKHENN